MAISLKFKQRFPKKSLKFNPKFSLKVTTSDIFKKTTSHLMLSLNKLTESLQFNQGLSTLSKPNMTMILNLDSLNAITSRSNIKVKKIDNNTEIFYMDFDDIVRQLKKKKLIKKENNESPPSSAVRKRNKNMSMKTVVINPESSRTLKSRGQTIKMENQLQEIKENEEQNSGTTRNRLISQFNEETTERNDNFLLVENEKFLRGKNKVSTSSPHYPDLMGKSSKFKNTKVSTVKYEEKQDGQIKLYKKSLSLDMEGEVKKSEKARSFENFLVEMKDFRDDESGSV